MNNDYLEVRNAEGMPNLADSLIALDFLLTVKSAIRNSAVSMAEVSSPLVKIALHNQLDAAVNMHRDLSQLMIEKGWLHPHDILAQLKLDLKSAQTAVQIARMELFPQETNRLGTFATPEK